MIEIERKFRLDSEQRETIEGQLQAQGVSLEEIHQVDEVFLQGIDSFAEFQRGMPVARLRTVNGNTQFAYKRSINEAGDMVEHELGVESAETMRQVLAEMDYRPVTIVEKRRLQAKLAGGLALMLDSVEKAGDFLEIEMMATDENELPEAERLIMQKANEFGLSTDDIETRKYDQLVASAPE